MLLRMRFCEKNFCSHVVVSALYLINRIHYWPLHHHGYHSVCHTSFMQEYYLLTYIQLSIPLQQNTFGIDASKHSTIMIVTLLGLCCFLFNKICILDYSYIPRIYSIVIFSIPCMCIVCVLYVGTLLSLKLHLFQSILFLY